MTIEDSDNVMLASRPNTAVGEVTVGCCLKAQWMEGETPVLVTFQWLPPLELYKITYIMY